MPHELSFTAHLPVVKGNAPVKVDEDTAYEKGVLLRNRYRFVKSLQQGSYGNVSMAIDITTNNHVAVKAMAKNVPGVTLVARHEAAMLTQVGKHPNVCQLLDSFETEGTVYLVLEYCSAGDLHDRVRDQGGLTSFTVYKLAVGLKEAILHAHARGVYHRDIKPENILFNASGDVKLADWGLATPERISRDSSVGTEKYMAPECFDAGVEYDTLFADYWSLGMSLLFAIFGKAPFTKPHPQADSNFQLFAAERGCAMDVLYDIYPDMSAGCLEALTPVLSLNPTTRNLDRCLAVLGDNWSLGLTVDEEYELDMDDEGDEVLFGMDDAVCDAPYLSKEDSTVSTASAPSTRVSLNESAHASRLGAPPTFISIPSIKETAPPSSLQPPPSLLGNSYMGKSWSDIEDEDDNNFFFQFETLSVSAAPTKRPSPISIGGSLVLAGGERPLNWF